MEDGNRNVRVLVLDDEDVLLVILSRLIRKLGCDVYTTDDGKKALAEHRENRFDAMFVDLSMPKMSGEEFIKMVRGMASEKDSRPVIAVVTGSTAVKLSGMPVEALILKPFNCSAILEVLDMVEEQND